MPRLIVKVLSLVLLLLTSTVAATPHYTKNEIQQRIIAQAKQQNVSPSLALAIAKVESNFNPQALSHAGAKGVMQIMPRTAEQGFGVPSSRLFEPDVNIELGVKFIKKLLERYNGRLDIALSHYNGGSSVKNRYGELSVIPATQNYVDKVLASQQHFRQHDNPSLIASHFDKLNNYPANIHSVDSSTTLSQADSETQRIKSLRALRLHNITRNYKGNKTPAIMGNRPHDHNSPSALAARNSKIAKVRQWESIYPD